MLKGKGQNESKTIMGKNLATNSFLIGLIYNDLTLLLILPFFVKQFIAIKT